jgi:hypothetical protein
MYFAPASWLPGMLDAGVDERREIFPMRARDADELAEFMWKTDSPYEHRKFAEGGLEIRAEGRSAVTLVIWLEGVARSAPTLAS